MEMEGGIKVIELHMMDKQKYFPLTMVSGFSVRGILYPIGLIKTRLQIQKGNSVYKGTFDAFYKITKYEGASGLYRGFWVNCLTILPSVAYIASYESMRNYMLEHTAFTDNKVRSFVAGGLASIIGQTLSVPVDIVSQHMMLLGQRRKTVNVEAKLTSLQTLNIPESARQSRFGAVSAVVNAIFQREGFGGFYKGYLVSLLVFAPNSALWWFFYDTYSDLVAYVSPVWVPRLAIQCMAAPMGGISAAIITNPLDVIRARMQVEGTKFKETVTRLWEEEGVRIIKKGLSARLVQSITFSFFIMLGYETIKRWSLLDEYKDRVRW